jgi:hypothetical protein
MRDTAPHVTQADGLRGRGGLGAVDMPALRPSAQDALRAVAQLGGHIRNNGPPGWQVLGRGYESLLLVQLEWIAREEM